MIETFMQHHSPSSLNLYAACPSLYVLERVKGLKQQVGAPAHRGSAVEAGVTHGLMVPDASVADCCKIADDRYDALMALSPDPRRAFYRSGIPLMVQQALPRLREYGLPSGTQGYVEWRPDGLRLPIVGYYDFAWAQHGVIADLKTTERMPSEIKLAHARQVSLYVTTDDYMHGHLIYVTPKRYEAYQLENVEEHSRCLLRIAQAVELLLSASDDADYYMRRFVPDLESFYWSNPEMRALAWEHWRI